jgi:hypothetical protein
MNMNRHIKKLLLWGREATHQQNKKLPWNHNHKEAKKEHVKLPWIEIYDGRKIFIPYINIYFLGSQG